MNIRKYIAKDAQEAMRMVKKEMGSDAVILRTRTVPFSDKTTSRSMHGIEVTAAVDYEAPKFYGDHSYTKKDNVGDLGRELREIKEALLCAEAAQNLNPEFFFDQELRYKYNYFKTFGLKQDVIRDLMLEGRKDKKGKNNPSSHLLQDSLVKVLSKIKTDGKKGNDNGRMIYSFIGPTGVGKTTTLAKLAALNSLQKGMKSVLVTLDTFRIAAAAQLEAYARIMGIPMEIAVSRKNLQKVLARYRNYDRIFIDTAGRSPNMDQDMKELHALLEIGEDIHSFLVLSATTQYKTMINSAERYETLPFNSYIFTKLDETEDLSTMINFLIEKQKPVSYFTTGQQVPEDIEIVSRKKLATFLLAGMEETRNNSLKKGTKDGSSCRS
jgi:flagellar biosynthesis protein FlhF